MENLILQKKVDFSMFDIEDETVKNCLENGMNLQECAKKIESELKTTQILAIQDCINNIDNLADLHNEINCCDKTLENLEKMLSNFLSKLSLISADMQNLKEQSVIINQQMHNRQKIRGELSQFVDNMAVPHAMIKIITETDVDDSDFLEQLHELQHKLQFLKAQEFKDAKAVGDVFDVVENLKFKAIEKIRKWLLLKISLFKKTMTNYQIPQNTLLKNRFFYEFLLANDRLVAQEIKDDYVDTLSKMFFSYFKTYSSRLFKLQMIDSATKDDLLGAEDAFSKSTGYSSAISNLFLSKPITRSHATVFSLGQRQTLLNDNLIAPLIVPHAAQQAHETFQFETLFQSIHLALVDHCSREFLFLSDFFMVNGQSAVDLFTEVMGRAIGLLLKIFEEKISLNYDAISLFLCICLCTKYNELMIKRSVVSIDGYWECITKLLWSRLEWIMNLHNESLKSFDVTKKNQSNVDTRPHYIIRRYAEFTYAFLMCSNLLCKKIDYRLQTILSKQQTEIKNLLNRLTSHCFRSKKDRLVFQINNYDVILNVLDEKVVNNSKERTDFFELQQTKIKVFIEEILSSNFLSLIQFIQECEPLIEQNCTQLLARYKNQIIQIIEVFNASWICSIETISNEIMQSFTNLKNGTNILQIVFTQFLHYYQRLNKILLHDAFQNKKFEQSLPNYYQITTELKKYKPLY